MVVAKLKLPLHENSFVEPAMPTKTELEKLLEQFRLHVERQAAKLTEQAELIARLNI
jgi:hypothetical protein